MPRECKVCNKTIRGRRDKLYCSPICKNQFHRDMKEENASVVVAIDAFLHRNRTILYQLFLEHRKSKLMISRIKLQKMGFRFTNFTGSYVNKQNKRYYHIYDFSWMEFTSNDILIVKR